MGEWPDNWFRDGQEPADGGAGAGSDANADKTVASPRTSIRAGSTRSASTPAPARARPVRARAVGARPVRARAARARAVGARPVRARAARARPVRAQRASGRPPPGGWPQQPPVSSAGGPATALARPGSARRGRPQPRRRPRGAGPLHGATRRPRRDALRRRTALAATTADRDGPRRHRRPAAGRRRWHVLLPELEADQGQHPGRLLRPPSPGSGTNWLIAAMTAGRA